MEKLVKYAVAALLAGYALFGKTMAYLRIKPVYIGEVVLAIGVIYVLFNHNWKKSLHVAPTIWLLLLMIWGATRTIPYISIYGKDALRDGASWGYGFFAIIIATLLISSEQYLQVIKGYRALSFAYLIWIPTALIILMFYSESIPILPWGPPEGISLISLKGGDIGVHLAGLAAFYALVFPSFPYLRITPLFWLGWGLSFIFVGFTGRAAFLTVSLTSILILSQKNYTNWIKWVSLTILIVSLFALFEIEVDTGMERVISFEQLTTNVKSIFGKSEGFSGEGSRMWRIMWWQKIIDYTVFGEYFWTGKGFGINLADDDGFQVLADSALRSPHNGHLTFLARAGIPGFFLWIGLQLSFSISLWKSYRRLLRKGYYQDASLFIWILVYWLAFMINGAFDVFLEGPQGGIWFWALIGVGISMLYAEHQFNQIETGFVEANNLTNY